ncbi:MAG: biopolymer transporter ExbD [Crocinitomicaceae bacterium]|nr:biopolymer transporter ExbD [Crocinitomicaceae bacterium]|tara:strand:- start:475 stop:864 length:390 start_codon:yes stop_codon:yes gene_type:complete
MGLSQRNKINVSAGMSSMTDLVFLLLIFFIIISTLVKNGVNVELPSSESSTSANPSTIVSVTKDGKYHVNSKEVNKEDVKYELSKALLNQEKKVVYLQIDEAVPTGSTVELIGMAKANDWKVMIGANKK